METREECAVCYNEYTLVPTMYFLCSHFVCSACTKQWQKSCPLCRSNRNNNIQLPSAAIFSEIRFVEIQPENDLYTTCKEIADHISNILTSKYGLQIENQWYEKKTYKTPESNTVIRIRVNRTRQIEGLHKELRSIFYQNEVEKYCVNFNHIQNTISVFF